jgi:hypothetical protein
LKCLFWALRRHWGLLNRHVKKQVNIIFIKKREVIENYLQSFFLNPCLNLLEGDKEKMVHASLKKLKSVDFK